MTSISNEASVKTRRQQLDIKAISQAYPNMARVIHPFSAFFTELNLKHYRQITSGEFLLDIDRNSRTHAFLVLLLALREPSPEVDFECLGLLRFSDYWNNKLENLFADVTRLKRPVTSKKWQSKLDVIIF